MFKRKKTLTPDDNRCIKEFINGVLQQTKSFYADKVSVDNLAILYQGTQGIVKIDELRKDILEIMGILKPINPIPIKKKYSNPQNTIERKFALYKDLQEGFYFNLRSENMLDVCLKEKHVVLLGEAGCGKSVALDQLAAMASDSYYTLRYSLNNYTDETIDQIINEAY